MLPTFLLTDIERTQTDLPKQAGIYAIRHTPSNSAYVGKSKCLMTRFISHAVGLSRHKHSNAPLLALFKNSKPHEFTFEVLEFLSEEGEFSNLRRMEREWVERLRKTARILNGIHDLPFEPGTFSSIYDIRFPTVQTARKFHALTATERGELIDRLLSNESVIVEQVPDELTVKPKAPERDA